MDDLQPATEFDYQHQFANEYMTDSVLMQAASLQFSYEQ
jgi:hypothetical protein